MGIELCGAGDNMKVKFLKLLAVIFSASVLCISSCGLSAVAGSPSKQNETETVRIGAVLPLSGSTAATGMKLRDAMKVAEDIINTSYPDIDMPLASGEGLPGLDGAKIEILFADYRDSPGTAKSEAERLIKSEDVAGLVGAYQSSATKAVGQASQRFRIPLISGSSSSATLTQKGLDYFWRIAPDDDMTTGLFFEYLCYLNDEFDAGIHKIGSVYVNNEYGVHTVNMIDKWIDEKYSAFGFEKVTEISYPGDINSVDAEVRKIMYSEADALFHSSYIGDITQFARSYAKFGFKPKAVLNYCGGFQDVQFVANVKADGDYFSGVTACTPTLFNSMPALNAVNELYKKRTGENIDGPALEEFASVMILAQAISDAGTTDSDSIKNIMQTKEFEAPYLVGGRVRFLEDGQNIYPSLVISQLQDERYEVVYPVDMQTSGPVIP